MFCGKCGSEVQDDGLFCTECGERVNEVAPSVVEKSIILLKKIPKRIWAGIAVAALVLIMVVVITNYIGKTISLNQYMSVTFDGYDTYGTATVNFDREKFIEDYGKKIKYINKSQQGQLMSLMYSSAAEALCDELDGGLDKNNDLSNGEVVTYNWDIDTETMEKLFGNKLKYSDIEVKVEGLKEIESFDPFADISVTAEGVSPYGYAEVVNHSSDEICSNLRYSIEPSEGLSNGDQVTITVSRSWGEDVIEYCAENYGKKPSAIEKTVTIEDLGSYASKIDEIPADLLGKMQRETEDALKAHVAKLWSENEKLDSMEYIGCYFLTAKDITSGNDEKNMLRLIYKIHASDQYTEQNFHDNFTFYYSTTFTNLMKDKDEIYSVDLSNIETPDNTFTRMVYYGEEAWDYDEYRYYGYETLDQLIKSEVTSYIDQYITETNIKE